MRSKQADEIVARIQSQKTPYAINKSGLELDIWDDVYPPGIESELLAKHLLMGSYALKRGERVYDYGTGSGYLALVAHQQTPNVLASDINAQAVKCAQNNFARNEVHIEARVGDGFSVLAENEVFDVILASLPFEDAKPASPLEQAVYDPGLSMRKQLFNGAKKHLSDQGRIFFTYSLRALKIHPLKEMFPNYDYEIIDSAKHADDTYVLYHIKMNA